MSRPVLRDQVLGNVHHVMPQRLNQHMGAVVKPVSEVEEHTNLGF